jgi:hypothetical protein
MLRVIHLFHTRFSLLTESAKPKVPSMEKTNSQLWQAHWPRPEDRLDRLSQLNPASCLVSALRLLLSEWARTGFVNAKRCGAKFAVLCLAALVSTGIVSAQVGANLEEVVQERSGATFPRAEVNTLNRDKNVAQNTTRGPDRNDRWVNLRPAPHVMTVAADGVGTVQHGVPLLLGSDPTVDFTLSVSSVLETATAAAAALNPIEVCQNKQTGLYLEGYNVFNHVMEDRGVSSLGPAGPLIRSTALALRILEGGSEVYVLERICAGGRIDCSPVCPQSESIKGAK